jgi:protein SCO1
MKRNARLFWWLLLPALVGVLAGCTSEQRQLQTYHVRGVVTRVEPEQNSVTIRHEEIPGLMAAMTMPFHARDAKELEGIEPGDEVLFRLTYTGEDAWIENISKTGNRDPSVLRPSARIVRDVEPLEVGDQIPDYQFTNELGKAVNLADFRGKAVALTFIFTRCPMPDFCPLMVKNFAAAYQKLEQMKDAPENWQLLSITIDPHFDTPEVLRRYATLYKYHPEKWSFVTGAMIDIDAITEQFDLLVINRGGTLDHHLRTAVIDPEGRLQRVFIYNEWSPDELVDEIIQAARKAE